MEDLIVEDEQIILVVFKEIKGKCPYCGSIQILRIEEYFDESDACECSECSKEYGLFTK